MFVTDVENEVTGDSKLNENPVENFYSTVHELLKQKGPTKDHMAAEGGKGNKAIGKGLADVEGLHCCLTIDTQCNRHE